MTSQSIVGEDLSQIYRARYGIWESLQGEVVHALEKRLEAAGLKVHSVTGRVKSLKSIEGKFRRRAASNSGQPDGALVDGAGALPLGLKDVVGVRVVCMYLGQIDHVVDVVRESFAVVDEDRKIAAGDVASFGYMSDHFVCRLNDDFRGPRYDDLKEIAFEVQVRTIAMDAWAAVSHHLDYKNEVSIPAELRKDFFALSGLFYVADTHFQMLYKQVEDLRARLGSEGSLESLARDDDLNVDTLAAYLHRRFPNRDHSDLSVVGELLEELIEANYSSLREVDISINRGEAAMLESESDKPPTEEETGDDTTYTDVGATRGAIGFADLNYEKMRLKRRGIEIDEDERARYLHLVAPLTTWQPIPEPTHNPPK